MLFHTCGIHMSTYLKMYSYVGTLVVVLILCFVKVEGSSVG